jgi:hypothetical protein
LFELKDSEFVDIKLKDTVNSIVRISKLDGACDIRTFYLNNRKGIYTPKKFGIVIKYKDMPELIEMLNRLYLANNCKDNTQITI